MNRPMQRSDHVSDTHNSTAVQGLMREAGTAAEMYGNMCGDMRRSFAVNGKFTSQRTTGVQRVASELTLALQRHARLPVIVPPDARADRPPLRDELQYGRLRGTLWEQLALPLAMRGSTLISLCNMAPLARQRQIVMIHDMAVYDIAQNYSWRFRLWYRTAFSMLKTRAMHILTVSAFSRQRIVERMGIDASRISVIRNAADHFERIVADADVVRKLGLTEDRYVLVVGSWSASKNLMRVLDAIQRLEGQGDYTFVIVGGTNARVFGDDGRQAGSLPRNAVMAGFVTDGELKALYESAGCFLFPSLYEGFGLPPLEAMYCGCPVIVSREASLPEVCGDAAMYCDAYSVSDIAEKVDRMMTDAGLRQHHRMKGMTHAHGYRWDDAARDLLAVLERIRSM